MKRILFLVCVVTLTACEGPGPLPRGYVHHKETYKSPAPGPTPVYTETQRETLTPAQAKNIRRAVHDLARALTDRAGLAPRAVYVQQADPLPPFYAMIDNDLREVLTHIGYSLAPQPDNAYVFQYDAQKIDSPSPMKEPPRDHNAPNVTLTLKIFDGAGREAKMLTTQSGDYFIEGAEVMDIPRARFTPMQKAGE